MNDKFNIVLRYKNKFIEKEENYTVEFDTIDEHIDIIKKNGFVWWGKFGRKLGQQKVELAVSNISRNLNIYLYLFSEDKCYKALLKNITNEIKNVDQNLIPNYYQKQATKSCGTFFKISQISEVDYIYNLRSLVLLNNPTKDSLLNGFNSQQSYFYVKWLEN